MKNTLSFIVFVLVVLGVMYLISGDRAPRMPTDPVHIAAAEPVCRDCHGPGKPQGWKPGHPPKEACLTCHSIKKTDRKAGGDR